MMELIGNHLWQSTLFAAIAALLTLFFRRNHARVRYALWLSASIKFLVPFSLLIAIGDSIEFRRPEASIGTPVAVAYVQDISQPFGSTFETIEGRSVISAKNPSSRTPWIAIVVYSAWACGFICVLLLYLVKGLKVRGMVRKAEALEDTRACAALEALWNSGGCRKQIRLASSSSSMEPGVFGIFRPVLLLPQGILGRLNDAELEAIIAHEIAHVRRHDNLLAVVHMFIEAVFWFHPMIWWLGTKLVKERENACDETVLKLGKNPQSYAEGILKVCEFCLESPLACVAGITGADMKKRIQAIMTHRIGRRMGPAKKLMLAMAGLGALAAPIVVGLINAPVGRAMVELGRIPSLDAASMVAPIANGLTDAAVSWARLGQRPSLGMPSVVAAISNESPAAAANQAQSESDQKPSFDVISVKPSTQCIQILRTASGKPIPLDTNPMSFKGGRFTGCTWLKSFMTAAYLNSKLPRFAGEPEWIEKEWFEIDAKAEGNPDTEQMRLMLQSLLEERFKLKVHIEEKEVDSYSLVVAKDGPKLRQSKDDNGNPIVTFSPPTSEEIRKRTEEAVRTDNPSLLNTKYSTSMKGDDKQMEIHNQVGSISALPVLLQRYVDRPVIDKTGISGYFDIKLRFADDRMSSQTKAMGNSAGASGALPVPLEPSAPSIYTALEEQLGLKLVPDKTKLKFLVIDNVERPSEN